MALVDKLQTPLNPTGISPAVLSAALYFWSLGEITRAQVVTALGLDAADEPQMDHIAAAYRPLSPVDRRSTVRRVEAATVLFAAGLITEVKLKELLKVV